jgi:EpsD family peptidyl-prolyl cis-trans isomerase
MHRLSSGPFRLLGTTGAVLSLATLLTACPFKDGKKAAGATDASQVAAQVNDDEISVHQVQALLATQPALAEQLGAAGPARALDSLIDQELAAQGARQAGLDTSPRVLQAMELAKREVLARAFQDHLAEKVVMPDSEAVNRYYEAHPELFAKRRRYSLQETVIKMPADKVAGMKAQVEQQSNAEAVNTLIKASGLPHSSRNSTQWAESLPMDLLAQLAYLKVGQSVAVPRPEGMAVLTVLDAEEVPLSRGQAGSAIQAALLSNARRDVVRKEMDALRQKAKIIRMGAFAQQPVPQPQQGASASESKAASAP